MVQYHGGKSKTGYELASAINSEVDKSGKRYHAYIEPFCGMCGVFRHIPELMKNKGLKYIAGDIHPSLILMWQSLQKGWKPPSLITEEIYLVMTQEKDIPKAVNAFIGFGCAWGGQYFCKYRFQNEEVHNLQLMSDNLVKQTKDLSDVQFINCEYTRFKDVKNCIIYCDPPYKGRHTNYTQSNNTQMFNTTEFYKVCQILAENNLVFLSEYTEPKGINSRLIYKSTTRQLLNGRVLPAECLYLILPTATPIQ